MSQRKIRSRQLGDNAFFNFQTLEYSGKEGANPQMLDKQLMGNSVFFASPRAQNSNMIVTQEEQKLIDTYAKGVKSGVYTDKYKNAYDSLTEGTMSSNDVRDVIKLLKEVESQNPPYTQRELPRGKPSRFDEKPTVAEGERGKDYISKSVQQVDKELADVIKRSQQTGDEYDQVVEESRRRAALDGYSLDQNPPPTMVQQPLPRPSRTTPYGETPYIDMETTPRKRLEFTPQPRIPEPYDSEVPQDLENMDSYNREQASGITVNKETEQDLKYRERQSAANTLHRFMNEERVLSSSSNSAFADLGTGDIYDGRQEVKDLMNDSQYDKASAQDRKPYVSEVYNERTGSGMSKPVPREFASGVEKPVDPNYYRDLVMGGMGGAESSKEQVVPRPTVTRGRLSDFVRLTDKERGERFQGEVGESKKDPNFNYWGGDPKGTQSTPPSYRGKPAGKTREQLLIDQANQEQLSRRSSSSSNIYPQIEGVSLPNYSSSSSSSSSSSENKPVTSRADLIDKAVRLGDYVNRGIATLTTIRNANEGGGEGGGMFQEIANRANLSADRNEEKKQDGLYGSKGSLFNQDVSNPRLLKERFEMGEQKVKNKFGKVNKYINMKNKSMLASQLLGQGVAAPSLKDLRGNIVEYNQPSASLKGNAVNLIRRGNATALKLNNEFMP